MPPRPGKPDRESTAAALGSALLVEVAQEAFVGEDFLDHHLLHLRVRHQRVQDHLGGGGIILDLRHRDHLWSRVGGEPGGRGEQAGGKRTNERGGLEWFHWGSGLELVSRCVMHRVAPKSRTPRDLFPAPYSNFEKSGFRRSRNAVNASAASGDCRRAAKSLLSSVMTSRTSALDPFFNSDFVRRNAAAGLATNFAASSCAAA